MQTNRLYLYTTLLLAPNLYGSNIPKKIENHKRKRSEVEWQDNHQKFARKKSRSQPRLPYSCSDKNAQEIEYLALCLHNLRIAKRV